MAIGWSSMMLASPLMTLLTPRALALLLVGGIVYSFGIRFLIRKSLRLVAMFDCLIIARL